MTNEADPDILNLLGIYYGDLGNETKEEKCYRECARVSQWAAPLLNLALAQKNRRHFPEAMETIEQCLRRRDDGPTFTLKAVIADGMNRPDFRDEALSDALEYFAGPRAMSDWELGWYVTAARMAGDRKKLDESTAEQRRRKEAGQRTTLPDGQLPMLSANVAPQ